MLEHVHREGQIEVAVLGAEVGRVDRGATHGPLGHHLGGQRQPKGTGGAPSPAPTGSTVMMFQPWALRKVESAPTPAPTSRMSVA